MSTKVDEWTSRLTAGKEAGSAEGKSKIDEWTDRLNSGRKNNDTPAQMYSAPVSGNIIRDVLSGQTRQPVTQNGGTKTADEAREEAISLRQKIANADQHSRRDGALSRPAETVNTEIAELESKLEQAESQYDWRDYDVGLAQRAALGAKSIGQTMMAAPGVIAQTMKQMVSDTVQSEQNKNAMENTPELEQARARLSEIAGQMSYIENYKYPTKAQARESEEWQELNAEKEELRTKVEAYNVSTPLDMSTPAMQKMAQAQQTGQDALVNLSGVPRFLGETALSIGQNAAMLPLAAVNPAAPLVGMGALAAAGKMYEVGTQGGTAGEAAARGMVSGGIEMLTEKIPLDHLMDLVKKGGESAIVSLLKQAGVEAGEESASYVLNYLADKAAKDPNAEFSLSELALAAAGGALSGGIMGGGATLLGRTTGGAETLPFDPVIAQNAGMLPFDATVAEQTKRAQEQKKTVSTGETVKYTAEEADKIRYEGNTFKNIVAGIDSTVTDFFSKWRQGRKSHLGEKLEKLYLGKMSDNVKREVSNILGYEVRERDFIITNDDVKHIMDEHGNAEAEIKKGNLPLGAWVLEAIPDVVTMPDSVTKGHEGTGKNSGKTGIKFEKTLPDGRVVCVQFDNKGRSTMEVTTVYAKESTLSVVPALEGADTRPPEVTEPVVLSNTTVPQTAPGVNEQYMQEAAQVSRDERAGELPLDENWRERQGMTLPLSEEVLKQERLARAKNETERSGILAGASDSAIEAANRLSSIVNRDIRFYDGNTRTDSSAAANGYEEGGVLYLNSRSANPVAQVVAHELTHTLEGTESYTDLYRHVLRYMAKNGDLTAAYEAKRQLYAKRGKELQTEEVNRELVAEYVEKHLLTDEESIRRLVKENVTLGQRIKYWLDSLIGKFNQNARERAFLVKARDYYVRALEESKYDIRSQQTAKAAQATLEDLRTAYTAGEITKAEFDEAMENVLQSESEAGEVAAERRYSIDPDFVTELETWFNAKNPSQRVTDGDWFYVGTTSDALRSIGVRNGNIYWRRSKVGYIAEEHPEMTLDVLKQVPEIIENPIVVLKSRTQEDSVVAFAELVANGKPIMVALNLTPTPAGGMEAEFALIASAYGRGKSNVANLVQNSEVLYLSEDKKRTDTWLMSLGLQLPSDQPAYGPMGSISYEDGFVNIQGVPWGELGETKKEEFPEIKDSNGPRGNSSDGRSIPAVQNALNGSSVVDGAQREKTSSEDSIPQTGEDGKRNFSFDETPDVWELRGDEAEAYAKDIAEEQRPLTVKEVAALHGKLKDARKRVERVKAEYQLDREEEAKVGKLLRGDLELSELKQGVDDINAITAVYEAKRQYENYAKQIRDWNKARKAKLREKADGYLRTANVWEDKSKGILYSRETMERNIRDIVPDRETAEAVVSEYFTPVHNAVAEATRTKNAYRDRVRALNLSTKISKADETAGKVSEAHAVQLLGEAEDNIRILKNRGGRIEKRESGNVRTRDGKTLAEWQAVVENLWTNNPQLNKAKIENAVAEFRKIYDELFEQMNESRIRNGYEPVSYRSGYFPHFQPGDGDGILMQFGKALGIDTAVSALPTSINGMSHAFKPGITWMGAAQERLGFNTAYDAVEGFDRYIEGVADVIHLTDSIQNLRAFASQIRYRTTDDGVREQVDKIRADERLTAQEKENQIGLIYNDPNTRYVLGNFVVELDEYINLLANKKSRADRNMEQAIGRDAYNVVKAMESRVAANMVAVNPASWLTNFIPLTQGWAGVSTKHMLQGMQDTLKAVKADDGIVGRSSFLTNRRGSDPLVQTWQQKASATLSEPMSWIDNFAADSLVRARYAQNIERGMSEAAAMEEADGWVAGVMADRSKGSTPTLFNRSNPVTKLFTQFQLEVNNQLGYVFKDLPRDLQGKGVAALACALLKFAIGAFLFDEVYEYFIGRRPALDPIGILNDTVGDLTGYQLPNLIEGTVDVVQGEEFFKKKEPAGVGQTIKNLAGNVAGELPFTSVASLAGFDIDQGRIPMSSALPDLGTLTDALTNSEWAPKKRVKEGLEEIAKPLTYLAPPFGGGQLKKIGQGIAATAMGGSYSVNAEGEDLLQYPVYNGTPGEIAYSLGQSMLFGKTTLPEAREWIESGFKTLSADETQAYKNMTEAGIPGEEAYELIKALRGAKKTESMTEAAVERQILRESEVAGEGKSLLYYQTMANDNEKALMDTMLGYGADMGKIVSVLMNIKDAEKQDGKLDAISDAGVSEKEAKELLGLVMGTELKTEKGNVTEYAKLMKVMNTALGVSDVIELKNSGANLDRFLGYTDAGISAQAAMDLALDTVEMREREDIDGTFTIAENAKLIENSGLTEDQQRIAWLVTYPEWAEKAELKGVSTSDYIAYKKATYGLTKKAEKLAALRAAGFSATEAMALYKKMK